MSKTKNYIFKGLLGTAFAFLAMPFMVNAQELAERIDTTVTVTEDVVLTHDVALTNKAKLIINGNVTIDLNGQTLEQASENYAIDIQKGSVVTIKNGSIICSGNNSSSCVRNYSELTLDGVVVKSVFTAVKNEEESTLHIMNSEISASWISADKTKGSAAVQNFGTADITDSLLYHESTESLAVAVYALTYKDFSSKITVTNSELRAPQAVQTYYDNLNGTPKPTTPDVVAEVEINGGIISEGSIINIRPLDATTPANGSLVVKGEVVGPISVLDYLAENATLVINTDVDGGDYEFNEGYTVIIPEDIAFNADSLIISDTADVRIEGNRDLVENEDGSWSIIETADYTAIADFIHQYIDGLDLTIYTEESLEVLANALDAIPLDATPDQQDLVDEAFEQLKAAYDALVLIDNEPIEENPDTSDSGIMSEVVLGFVSFIGIAGCGLYVKKANAR